MQFPADWPPTCPPDDSLAAEGAYFRVGRNNPPSADDFRSQAELGQAVNGNVCLRVGLSTLRTFIDAEHLTRMNRRLGSVIYRGELDATHGKSKLTSSRQSPSHTTWWPCEGIDRVARFTVVEA